MPENQNRGATGDLEMQAGIRSGAALFGGSCQALRRQVAGEAER